MPQLLNLGWSRRAGTKGAKVFDPSELPGLKLWTRFNSGITVTGAGVSQWDDQSGEGNHLLQGTDTNRPSKEADGSILFDGVDNYLKAAAFTLNQPETVYILGKQVTWANGRRFFDGNTLNSGIVYQTATTPKIAVYAGIFGADSTDLILDTYGAIAAVFDVSNSLSVLQVDNTPSIAGTPGAGNMGGFTLAAGGDISNFGHIQIKEVIVYNIAHDAVTREKVINYLQRI